MVEARTARIKTLVLIAIALVVVVGAGVGITAYVSSNRSREQSTSSNNLTGSDQQQGMPNDNQNQGGGISDSSSSNSNSSSEDSNDSEDDTDGDLTEDIVLPPITADPDFTTAPAIALANARTMLEAMIRQNDRLSPLFVRLGFHDCVGGCDGCIDLDNIDNLGLAGAINALRPIVEEYAVDGVSRADIWALAATTGADLAQGRERVDFDFTAYGRATCEQANDVCRNQDGVNVVCDETHGPHRDLPSADLTTHQLLDFFAQNFDFSLHETVAIMGAHTLGRLRRRNSGFDGDNGWVRREDILDNEYYEGLVGGRSAADSVEALFDAPNWNQVEIDNRDLAGIPNRHQWNRGRDGTIMLNVDISLVRDIEDHLTPATGEVSCQFKRRNQRARTICPAAETLLQSAIYRHDNMVWLQDFEETMAKMLLNGSTVTSDCAEGLCRVIPSN